MRLTRPGLRRLRGVAKASDLAAVAETLDNLTPDAPGIMLTPSGALHPPRRRKSYGLAANCTGNGWIGRYYKEGLNSDTAKEWIKVNVATTVATEENGPPSNPCPEDEVWFKKSATYGDFRVDRLG